MRPLTVDDLLSLERYAIERPAFRERVMRHKRDRRVALGPDATLYFEDRLTIQYQIQEMLRAERIFEPAGIREELEAYNPLIPDGGNLEATFMLEYADPVERQRRLAGLRGVEDRVWIEVEGAERCWAIADEDLERANEEKTSAVHFLRFELAPAAVEGMRAHSPVSVGIDHPELSHHGRMDPVTVGALARDLD